MNHSINTIHNYAFFLVYFMATLKLGKRTCKTLSQEFAALEDFHILITLYYRHCYLYTPNYNFVMLPSMENISD